MVHLNFAVSSPVEVPIKTLWHKPIMIGKFKAIELQLWRCETLFGVGLDVDVSGDHPGICMMFDFFTFGIMFHFYDSRHEDFENDNQA